MINPHQSASEVDEPNADELPPSGKRLAIKVIAAIIFFFISLFLLMRGSVVESGEAFLVGLACLTVGKRQ